MKNIPYGLIVWALLGACVMPWFIYKQFAVFANIPDESFEGDILLYQGCIEAFFVLIASYYSVKLLFHRANLFKVLGLLGLGIVFLTSFLLKNANPHTQPIALISIPILLLWMVPNSIVEIWLDRMKGDEEKAKIKRDL